MIGFIVTVFYIAGVVCAVHAIMTARTAQGAVAWSIGLVSFPFMGVPAYLVLGRSKFEGMAEAYGDRKDEIDAVIKEFHQNLEPWDVTGDERYTAYAAVKPDRLLVWFCHSKLTSEIF